MAMSGLPEEIQATASADPNGKPPASDYLFKLFLIGDCGVGKRCLALRFCVNSFSDSSVVTIGIDFWVRTIELDGKKIKLQIWVTSGQRRFLTLPTFSYYRGAHGILLIYDVTDERSFHNIRYWVRETERYAESAIKMLIGNKCDMEDEKVVDVARGKALADEYGIKFLETSAKTNLNVEQAFFMLAKDIMARPIENTPDTTTANPPKNDLVVPIAPAPFPRKEEKDSDNEQEQQRASQFAPSDWSEDDSLVEWPEDTALLELTSSRELADGLRKEQQSANTAAASDNELPRIALEDDPDITPLLLCPACNHPFDQASHTPRMIKQCGHTACHHCLVRSRSNSNHPSSASASASSSSPSLSSSTIASCSICQINITNPNVIEDYPLNYALLQFVEALQSSQLQSNQTHKCQHCEDAPQEFGCMECGIQFCSPCWKLVHRGAFAKHHQVSVDSVRSANDSRCPVHASRVAELVCKHPSCDDALICILCEKSGAHKGHVCVMIEDAAAEKREAIRGAINKARIGVSGGVHTLVDVHTNIELLQHNEQSSQPHQQPESQRLTASNLTKAIDDIRDRFTKLRQACDEREATLIEQVKVIAANKTAKLMEQQTEVHEFLVESYNALHHAIDSITNDDDRSLLSSCQRCVDRLNEVGGKLWVAAVVNGDVGVSFDAGNELAGVIGAHGKVVGGDDDGDVQQQSRVVGSELTES